jgi:hypothetical protein
MPVAPQEYTPSLSPRQSFGYQPPLPWVTATDRTGSLRALWQLQGSFQEFSPSSAHSLTWRESRSQAKPPVLPTSITSLPGERVLHNWPTSHTQSSTAWSQQPTGKTDTSFPIGSTMAGHFLFLNPPTQDRLTLWLSGTRDKQSTQGSTQVRTVQTGDVPAIPEQTQIHAFLVQRMHEGFSAGVRPVHLLAIESRMEEEPLSRLILAVYLHAPGLTLVTLGTACVPSACIRFAHFPLVRNLG